MINGSLIRSRIEEFVRGYLLDFELDLDKHIVGSTSDCAAIMEKLGKEIRPDPH